MVCDVSSLEDRDDLHHKRQAIVMEAGNFDVERVRVAYIEALVADCIFPSLDSDADRLEATLFKLPCGAVNKLAATAAQLAKARGKNAALLLEGFQRRYISQSRSKAGKPALEG